MFLEPGAYWLSMITSWPAAVSTPRPLVSSRVSEKNRLSGFKKPSMAVSVRPVMAEPPISPVMDVMVSLPPITLVVKVPEPSSWKPPRLAAGPVRVQA